MSPPIPREPAGPGRGGPASSSKAYSQWTAFATLLPHLWPRGQFEMRARVVLALLCLAAAKFFNIFVPMLFKRLVDGLTHKPELVLALPLGLLLAYGIARVLTQSFSELRDAVFARVAQRAIRKVALDAFRHLHNLSMRFHLDRQTGGLSRVIERGAKGIEFLLFFVLFNILPTILEIGLVCGILWWLYDWRYAAVTFVTIGGYVWFTFALTEWRIKHRRRMNEADQEANTKAIDSLLNYETVKYFGNEEHEARRYDVALQAYEHSAVRTRVSLAFLNIGQNAIIATGVTLLMGMAALEVVQGKATVGDFVLVNAYLIQLYLPLNFLGTVYREIRQALIDMEAMFALLGVDVEVADKPGAPPLKIEGGRVEFRHVAFGYDPRRPILKDVSFTVEPGRTLAIVGPSGAGKSTISRLLFRFYDVTDGAILIDGQNIADVQQASLRAAIGVVPQDTVLFNDTLKYNIAYGRPSAGEDEVIEAARLARLHDLVERLPDGYATKVGERGLKLSGGEKQRVAIARALLKEPAIMLFDEATSALDSRTEKEIQKSLSEVSADRTTLMIAHRLSTVIDADEIIVLEEGHVVERGRHSELLAKGGVYAAMWARQQKAAADEAARQQQMAAAQ
jgi:ABC-type transport system involved in Fe-S cluster assembly fused permease/ATPase subunit